MRRIRRLLPAALLVLMATLLASRLFAPDSQWKGAAHEAIAAAFYGENWNLAARAVDYLAAETAPSPIQHYWSLSVEEQFYAVWPILVLIARRLGRSVSSTLVAGRRSQRRRGVILGLFDLCDGRGALERLLHHPDAGLGVGCRRLTGGPGVSLATPHRFAVAGNYHAVQWLPALQQLATTHHWKIVTFLASQCFAMSIRIQLETEEFRRNCFDWG